ncbi:MAG: S41 family peptidase [Pirellulales bacterium]
MSRRNFLLLIGFSLICTMCFMRTERNPYARYLGQVFHDIDRWALERVPPSELFDGAVDGMVDLLDEHSAYIGAQDTPQFEADLEQEFGGIGVVVMLEGEPEQLTVVSPPMYGTPAHKAGIRSGDVILAIDGEATDGMTMRQILRKMRGQQGEAIELSIRHEDSDSPESIELVRNIINIPSLLGDLRRDDGLWDFHVAQAPEVGYIRIASFGEKTVGELEEALAQVRAQGARGLILDLRDNPGGLLDAAVDICDMFLGRDRAIVTIESRQNSETMRSSGGGLYQDMALVVLVNQNSASASEILAGCLKDHERAAIAGQRTYGKGTVQQVIRIESGRSILKLTTARYVRPNGHNIHRREGAGEDEEWGVHPDPQLAVSLTDEERSEWFTYRNRRDLRGPGEADTLSELSENDPQLYRAVEYLQNRSAEHVAGRAA